MQRGCGSIWMWNYFRKRVLGGRPVTAPVETGLLNWPFVLKWKTPSHRACSGWPLCPSTKPDRPETTWMLHTCHRSRSWVKCITEFVLVIISYKVLLCCNCCLTCRALLASLMSSILSLDLMAIRTNSARWVKKIIYKSNHHKSSNFVNLS